MHRRSTWPAWIAGVAVILVALAGYTYLRTGAAIPRCKNCNVILLDIDTLRADELSCLGYPRPTTPNLCAFAKKGVLFTRNISQDNWTLPSLMSTLTSLYTDYHRMVLGQGLDKLNPAIPTLSGYFRDNRYETFLLSQTAASYLPGTENQAAGGYANVKRGDPLRLLDAVLRAPKTQNTRFFIHAYIDTLHSPYSIGDRSRALYPVNIPPEEETRIPTTTEDYRSMIGEYLVDHPDEVFLPRTRTERPDLYTGDRQTRKQRMIDYFFSDFCNGWTCAKRWNVELSRLMSLASTPASTAYLRMMYDTRIAQLDRELAQVFASLSSSGRLNDTIVVITSSHGEEFKEHGGLAHENTSYNELIRTPLIIVTPRMRPRVVTALTENIDLMPTLLQLTGIAPRGPMQGVSLVPVMEGGAMKRTYAISGDLSITGVASIEQDHWKLVRTANGDRMLYDLSRDPGEQRDVSGQNPQKISQLTALLKATLTKTNPYPPLPSQPTPIWLNPETKARLIRDGYF